MKTPYPGASIQSTTVIPSTGEKKLVDVIESFSQIGYRPSYIGIHENDLFGTKDYKVIQNHFQGIARFNKGEFIVISGGNKGDKRAHLMVAKMGDLTLDKSTQKIKKRKHINGNMGTNLLQSQNPPVLDNLHEIYWLNKGSNDYWHAGGISTCGDVLAVALENQKSNSSKIVFYNASDPENLTQIQNAKIQSNKYKAGSVALTKLKNKHYLCVVWSDSDNDKDLKPPSFRVYISESKNDLSKWKFLKNVPFKYLTPEVKTQPKFQSLNFIQQANGELFLVGTDNSIAIPDLGGTNRIFLLKLKIEFGQSTILNKLHILYVMEKHLADGDNHVHFAAAAGIYLFNNRLSILGAHHWRSDDAIRIGEFVQLISNEAVITTVEDIVIELYEHSNFKGRCLYLIGRNQLTVPDYSDVKAQGKSFGGKVSSIRAIIPLGKKFTISDKVLMNGEVDKSSLKFPIIGNGHLKEYPTLNKYSDVIKSSILT